MTTAARTGASMRSNSIANQTGAGSVIGATSTSSDAPTLQDKLIDEILKKGLMKWGQDQRLDELKAKLRGDVLKGLGLTEEDLAKMPPDQRADVEKQIDNMIRQRLEAALAEGQDKQNKDSLSPGQPAPKAKPALIINV
jgi:hypothetical protein